MKAQCAPIQNRPSSFPAQRPRLSGLAGVAGIEIKVVVLQLAIRPILSGVAIAYHRDSLDVFAPGNNGRTNVADGTKLAGRAPR